MKLNKYASRKFDKSFLKMLYLSLANSTADWYAIKQFRKEREKFPATAFEIFIIGASQALKEKSETLLYR